MKPLMKYVDVCIGNEEDAELCWASNRMLTLKQATQMLKATRVSSSK